jgi:hypothetical protein
MDFNVLMYYCTLLEPYFSGAICLYLCHFPIAGLPTSYVTGGNGNINIHVSVTINAGTLADLKKQRSQIRNSSPDGMTGLSPVSSVTSSPMPSVQRFTGDTDEVVGDPKPKRCCIIS